MNRKPLPAPTPADRSEERIRRQLQHLGKIIEAGMSQAEVVSRRVEALADTDLAAADGAGIDATLGDASLDFERISRAIRQTIVLEMRLADDLSRLLEAKAQRTTAATVRAARAGALRRRIMEMNRSTAEPEPPGLPGAPGSKVTGGRGSLH